MLGVIEFAGYLVGKGCFGFKVGKTWNTSVTLDSRHILFSVRQL